MLSQFIENIRKANRLIAGGMFFFESPGHMLSESDYLLRLISHYPLIKARSPVVILPPSPMSTMMGELLKLNNVQVLMDPNAIGILREIQLFHPDLILEIGQAHCKLVVPDKQNRGCGDLYPLNLCWALRSDEFIGQLIKWHEAWNATRGQLPLRDAVIKMSIEPELRKRLEANKYAVVQIKAQTGNGTARILSGELYRPAFELLKDEGYSIILGGREPMPEEFKRFDVFDYPRSKFVNPKNDFFLFSRASVGLVSPSGAGLFCDTLGIPCCQIGSWTLLPHPSEKTLMVPSRLRERSTAKILTFSQQATSFRQVYHEVRGPGYFDTKTYEDIPPSPEEIRAGLHETLHGCPAETSFYPLAKIHQLDPMGMWRAAASKLSSAFLAAHPEFLS
jgi:putative glycosyltransferase (TIGR04372 family)